MNKTIVILLYLILSLFVTELNAQTAKIDSLKKLIQEHEQEHIISKKA